MPITRLPTAEEQQQGDESTRQGLYGLGISALGKIMPPVIGGADSHDWTNYLPFKGLATSAYSQAAGLGELLAHGAADFTNYDPVKDPTPEVHIPGRETAQKLSDEANKAAENVLPKYEPVGEAARMGRDIGTTMGDVAFTGIPEVGLPKGIAAATHIAVPPLKAAPVGAVIGGTVGAFTPDKVDAAPQAEAQPQPDKPVQVAANTIRSPYDPVVTTDATPARSPYDPVPQSNVRPQLPTINLSPENDSGVSYGQWGLGLGVAAATAWGVAKYGPRTLNVISDAVRGQTRDIGEATRLATTPGATGPGGSALEMPLPNDAGGLSRRLAVNAYNPNAVMNEVVKSPLVSPNPGEAAARVAANEMINNPANAQRRMEGLFRSGVEDGTGHVFPKVIEYKGNVDALSPDQQQAFHQAAWDKSELNLRDEKFRQAPSASMDDPQHRVSMTDISTSDMRARVAAAEADPQIAALLAQNKAFGLSLVDSLEARGNITPAEANYARTARPDYMPTVTRDGNLVSAWTPGVPATDSGFNTPPAPAWEAMIKHFDNTIRSAQLDDWQRTQVLNMLDAQQRNPSKVAPVVVERSAPSASRRSVIINTATGKRYFDINNTAFYQGLTQGPQVMGHGMATANFVRRFYQNMTTGTAAMMFGHPFAMKNFIRDTMLIPAQAQKGLWRGELDKALGVRLPYDPTFAAGAGVTAVKDASTVFAKNFADMLASRGNLFSAMFRGVTSDAQIDSWVKWIRASVEHSKLMQREAQGVGAGGNRSLVDMNNLVQGKQGSYRDPTASSVSPLLNKPNFARIPGSVPLTNVARGTVTSAINLNTLAKELYGVISDAPHSYLHDLNVGNPKFPGRTLASAVQEVTGNPGTQGRGGMTRALSQSIPYYNTSVQAVGRSLAAFRDNPLAMGTTVGTVLATVALAEHLSALISGPEHVQHLEEKTTNSVKTRNAIIYHGPGTDPNDHTEIPIPNEWQPIHPYTSGLTGLMLSTWNAHAGDPNELTRLIHTIASVFGKHVSTDIEKQTNIGIASAGLPIDMPLPGQLAIAATTGRSRRTLWIKY